MKVDFITARQHGSNAKQAFEICCYSITKERGSSGVKGTIAEKKSFVVIPEVEGVMLNEAMNYANRLVDKGDKRVIAKDGPAGCIKLDTGEFFFFGFVSADR